MLRFEDIVMRNLRQLEIGDDLEACASNQQRWRALLHEGALLLDSDVSSSNHPIP